jgi:copper chaperone NosL
MLDRFRFKFFPAIIVGALLIGCGPRSDTGPGEIHWDRQTCERCQMVISERRHAVQIRELGARRIHAFDDLGCALLWLEEQKLLPGSEGGPEVWAMDSTASDWIDAREAQFEAGLTTPMAYGFGVATHGISLAEVGAQVRETELNRRSGIANRVLQNDDEKGQDLE